MSKKEEILQAAIECFTSFGFSKTSMSDIGRRVGMNKASLYYHYKDKIALYDAVIQHIRNEKMFSIMADVEEKKTGKGKILAYVSGVVGFWGDVSVSFFSATDNGLKEKEGTQVVLEKVLADDVSNLVDLLNFGIDTNEFRSIDQAKIAQQIISMCQGILWVNCPLVLPTADRPAAYEIVIEKCCDILEVYLDGIK